MSKKLSIKRHISLDIELCITHDISYPEWILCSQIEFLSIKKGYCYAKRSTLAEALKITTRGLSKMIDRMEEKGLLKKTDHNGLIVTDLWLEMQSTKGEKPEQSSTCEVEQSSGQSGTKFRSEVELCSTPTIKREIEGRKEGRKKSIKKSSFTFSLKQKTAYENLSKEYKAKLYAKCILLSGEKQKVDDFILSLEANGYKYKNFLSAFKKWHGITGDETHSNFSPEPILGEEWVRVIQAGEAIAVNTKTLDMRTGKAKIKTVEEEKPEMEMSAKSFFEEIERRRVS